jgi:arginine N-succinyltransferase
VFVIRSAQPTDIDALLDIARHLDSVNLPNERARVTTILERSTAAFSRRTAVSEREFVFVLESREPGKPATIVGCSMLFAQHGTRRAPHVYFDVLEEERYSDTIDRHFVHKVLRIGFNYKGVTEVGGLVLLPSHRGHPEQLGKMLSFVRFLYIARHRGLFRDELLAELMPPLQPDGRSLLWESLGRRFTGLDYQEADRLSRENKEFIKALFPQEPIYVSLLSPEARSLIGEVGASTLGVAHMLRSIGFQYANRIDPFDGGPHFHARTDDVTLVAQTQQKAALSDTAVGDVLALVGGEGSDGLFRAVRTRVVDEAFGVAMSAEVRMALDVEVGAEVAVLRL